MRRLDVCGELIRRANERSRIDRSRHLSRWRKSSDFRPTSGPCDAWSEIRDEAEAFYQGDYRLLLRAEPGPQVQSFADVFGPALAMCALQSITKRSQRWTTSRLKN